MARRDPSEQSLHDAWVQMIADQRMPFPSSEHPTWRTYLNEPDRRKGLKTADEVVYPDLVVVEERTNVLVMIGEVETASSVNEHEVIQWRQYSSLCGAFFLYVPDGCGPKAAKLASGMSLAGIRTYGVNAERAIQISNLQ